MIQRDKIFGNNKLINFVKLIFYPAFKLHQELSILIKNPESWVVSGLFIVFIGGMMFFGVIYCAITPISRNLFNPILKSLPINNHIIYNLYLWYTTISLASYLGYYLGNISAKLYCYVNSGHPNIYLNECRLQKITIALNNKGYHNLNLEILSEIIEFCIHKSHTNKSNVLGNHNIDWQCTLEHLMESDLEYFLEQQYVLRNQRKKYIRKIMSFYIYHRDCHNKTRAEGLPKTTNRKPSNISNASKSSNQSSVETNVTKNLELNKEFLEDNTCLNEKMLLFSTLESNVVISQNSIEATKKDYELFKQNYLKKIRKKNISPYQEYLLLDNYEHFLYQHASEISASIFPEEIITFIEMQDDYLQIPNTQDYSSNFLESFIYPHAPINNLSDLSMFSSRRSTLINEEQLSVSLKIE